MANIKFSQFTQKTTLGTVDFLVGYTGADNVQIDPADLLSDYSQGTGAAGQVTFFSATSTVTGDNNLYWDNTNKRLGIGTATPGNKLEVQVTSNGNGVLFKSNATQIGSILRTAIGGTVSMTVDGAGTRPININNSSSSNVLIANGGGNVGIGTTSPVAKLQVEGSFISSGISQLGTTGANVYLTSSSAGNVGIGDSSPTAKLVVDNVGTKMLELKRSGNIKFRVLADANHGQLNMFNSGTSNTVRLHTSGDSYFNGGNVGIGTTSPSEKLHVQGNVLINGAAPYLSIKTTQTGTPDWKIYNSYNSVGDLAIVGGSSVGNKFNIQPNGNVGIGTTSPGRKLQVEGGDFYTNDRSDTAGASVGYGGNSFQIRNGSTSEDLNFDIFNRTTSAWGTPLIIKNTGNVGIGTTSPNANLEIDGGSSNAFIQFTTPNTNYAGIRFGDPQSINAGRIQYYHGAGSLEFDTEVRFAFQGGDVGIGTDSPNALLHLESASSPALQITDTTQPTTLRLYAQDSNTHIANITAHDMVFDTNNTERMRIDSAGNVGIGTTSPDSLLHVAADVSGANTGTITIEGRPTGFLGDDIATIDFQNNGSKRADIRMERGDAANDSQLVFSTSDAGTLNDALIIKETGNVGIGTTAPAAKLDISNGTNSLLTLGEDSGRGVLRLYRNTASAYLQAWHDGTNGSIITTAGSIILSPSSGNVGIGTTNPETLAHIKVNGGSAQLTLEREGGGAGKAVLAGAAGGLIVYNDAFATKMYVGTSGSYDGNVGIGTISPQYKLDVDGDVQINETLIAKAGADLILQARSSQIVGINSNGTRTMTLDASNNVGIGTSSPASKLEVDGGDIEVDDSASGLILRSPDGTRYRVTVANGGTLSVSAV